MNRRYRKQYGGAADPDAIEAENPKPAVNPDAVDLSELQRQVAAQPTLRLPIVYKSNIPIYPNYGGPNVGHVNPTLKFRNRGL